ncbi:MAG TPA: hypothetical protein VHQ87_08115 [Rhizobacter sp.]|jgi:hypothetical protein|nr:hypothetical protein [Rhizobacter sp.]
MNHFSKHILRATVALLVTSAASMAIAATSFTSSYKGGSTASCGTTYSITGAEPSTSGKYPVYVHIGGTGEQYNSAWAMAAVNAMAAQGFVAASIQYDNASFGTCSTISTRAKCIFDSSKATSAIQTLCSRAKADCSKGVVTGGLSQGSIISILSKNYDSRVQASMGQGAGATYTAAYNLSSCVANGNHTQTGDRIRVINGQTDMFVGGTITTAGNSGKLVTGKTCTTGATSCLAGNGSGWLVVRSTEVSDLDADHCFMGYGGVVGVQCSGALVDPIYQNGSAAWALPATVNWLKSFVTP